MINNIADSTILNNGIKMPWLGFGCFKIDDGQQVENSVRTALEQGYRSIDTAFFYANESGVGKAIRESGVKREDVFITTKIWNQNQREKKVMDAFDASLRLLGTDYVDLYLIHWPVPGCYLETWEVFEKIYESGRAKAIGVSNFLTDQLEDILGTGGTVPAVNQVEFHPFLVQPELLQFCKDKKIQPEAWSPLMQGRIVSDPAVMKLAEKHNRTPAQIVLRWDLQHDVITIPKSVRPERIIENSQIFDFELSKEDMDMLDALDEGKRVGPDPHNFNF